MIRSIRVISGPLTWWAYRKGNEATVRPVRTSAALQSTPLDKLRAVVERLIQPHRGRVGMAFKHLDTSEAFSIRGDEVFPTASLIKIAVMAEVFAQVEDGKRCLGDRIALRAEDKVPGAGVLQFLDPCLELTLFDAVRLMIILSDNTATNLVLDRIGLPATAQRMEAWGFPHTKIHAKVFRRETSIFPERSAKYGLGSTTPNETIRLLEMIHRRACVSREASDQMLDILKRCDDERMLKRYLPSNVVVAHKTGAIDASRMDAGIISGTGLSYALCVITTENQDQSWSLDNAAHLLIGKISRAVFDHVAK